MVDTKAGKGTVIYIAVSIWPSSMVFRVDHVHSAIYIVWFYGISGGSCIQLYLYCLVLWYFGWIMYIAVSILHSSMVFRVDHVHSGIYIIQLYCISDGSCLQRYLYCLVLWYFGWIMFIAVSILPSFMVFRVDHVYSGIYIAQFYCILGGSCIQRYLYCLVLWYFGWIMYIAVSILLSYTVFRVDHVYSGIYIAQFYGISGGSCLQRYLYCLVLWYFGWIIFIAESILPSSMVFRLVFGTVFILYDMFCLHFFCELRDEYITLYSTDFLA